MEEIVRAFNYVIEKGWVSLESQVFLVLLKIFVGILLGHVRMVCKGH